MLIYKLTFASGKVYIGQTVRAMEVRFRQHRASANMGSLLAVHCAWRKHGEPALDIIGSYDDLAALNEAEAKFIADHDCLSPKGYNLSLGGNNAPKHPDMVARIAAKNRGKVYGPETRAKVAASSREKWATEEYREKVLAGVAASMTEERRAHLSSISKARWAKRKAEGWVMPDGQRAKIKARTFSDETRAKMSAAAKARKREPRSEETRAKIAANTKEFWSDPERAMKRSQEVKAGHQAKSPEERSDAAHRAWKTKRAKDQGESK